MIKCYFGVPGCGKTTILTKIAQKKRKKYKEVYTINFECFGCIPIKFEDLGKYKIENSLILIDEITMDADNRAFKTFPKEIRDFFILHRHLKSDIIYATQNYENVDKKIRDLTGELWYMSKSVIPIIREFTTARRIYRNININEYTSDLTLGYRFCNFIESLFASNFEWVYRRRYYKYFNSFELLTLEERQSIEEKETIRIGNTKKNKLGGIIKNARRKRRKISNAIINYLQHTNRNNSKFYDTNNNRS